MANNRAYLVCLTCVHADDTTWEQCRFPLLKYFPSEGWYVEPSIGVREHPHVALNRWLDQHKHGTLLGEEIKLITESVLDPNAPKLQILAALFAAGPGVPGDPT